MRYWQLCKGNFVPHCPNSTYLTIGQQSADEVAATLKSGKYKVVCVNDDPMQFDFETEKEQLIRTFRDLFPTPSSFEKADANY